MMLISLAIVHSRIKKKLHTNTQTCIYTCEGETRDNIISAYVELIAFACMKYQDELSVVDIGQRQQIG